MISIQREMFSSWKRSELNLPLIVVVGGGDGGGGGDG